MSAYRCSCIFYESVLQIYDNAKHLVCETCDQKSSVTKDESCAMDTTESISQLSLLSSQGSVLKDIDNNFQKLLLTLTEFSTCSFQKKGFNGIYKIENALLLNSLDIVDIEHNYIYSYGPRKYVLEYYPTLDQMLKIIVYNYNSVRGVLMLCPSGRLYCTSDTNTAKQWDGSLKKLEYNNTLLTQPLNTIKNFIPHWVDGSLFCQSREIEFNRSYYKDCKKSIDTEVTDNIDSLKKLLCNPYFDVSLFDFDYDGLYFYPTNSNLKQIRSVIFLERTLFFYKKGINMDQMPKFLKKYTLFSTEYDIAIAYKDKLLIKSRHYYLDNDNQLSYLENNYNYIEQHIKKMFSQCNFVDVSTLSKEEIPGDNLLFFTRKRVGNEKKIQFIYDRNKKVLDFYNRFKSGFSSFKEDRMFYLLEFFDKYYKISHFSCMRDLRNKFCESIFALSNAYPVILASVMFLLEIEASVIPDDQVFVFNWQADLTEDRSLIFMLNLVKDFFLITFGKQQGILVPSNYNLLESEMGENFTFVPIKLKQEQFNAILENIYYPKNHFSLNISSLNLNIVSQLFFAQENVLSSLFVMMKSEINRKKKLQQYLRREELSSYDKKEQSTNIVIFEDSGFLLPT